MVQNEATTNRQPTTEETPITGQNASNGTVTNNRERTQSGRTTDIESVPHTELPTGNSSTNAELPIRQKGVERQPAVEFDGQDVSEPDNITVETRPTGFNAERGDESANNNYDLTTAEAVRLSKAERRKINARTKQLLEKDNLTEEERIVYNLHIMFASNKCTCQELTRGIIFVSETLIQQIYYS